MTASAKLGGGQRVTIEDALDRIAAAAAERDRAPLPPFPEDAIALLETAGVFAWNAGGGDDPRLPPAAAELKLVRRTACADGSVGRILDGHLNAVERLAVQAPPEVRDRELAEVRERRLRAGVWGGDPRPGEGTPAEVVRDGPEQVLRGVKTFCSGAGGLDRALILARNDEPGPPVAVWVDLNDRARVEIDDLWFRGSGLRASVSHRIVFHDAPVLARFGGPGALAEQPWFARDALRTAASWAGMADAAVDGALSNLSEHPGRGALEEHAAGRILTEQRTIDVWLDRAGRAMDDPGPDLAAIAIHGRAAIAAACRSILDEAARACGSHPFARGGGLDRARRDLELFLLQHRLDPLLARAGAAALEERGR